MTALDKLLDMPIEELKKIPVEEIKKAKKLLLNAEKEVKNVGNEANLAILRGIVAKDGFDALKRDYAVVRKENKIAQASKAEVDLGGLGNDEGEEDEIEEEDIDA